MTAIAAVFSATGIAVLHLMVLAGYGALIVEAGVALAELWAAGQQLQQEE